MLDLAFRRSDPGTDTTAPNTPPPRRPQGDAPAPHALGGADVERLMHLLDLLEAVDTEPQFKALLDGPMQGLLPHRSLACGTGRLLSDPGGIAPQHQLLHRFPTAYLESLRQADGLLRSPLTDRWLHTRQPVLVELLHDSCSWPADWVHGARRHGFINFAAHAFFEPTTHSITSFCFADVPGRLGPPHAQLLRLLVPHLHLALVRITGIGAPMPMPPHDLHPHQLDILRWLHVGKTNWEISMIIGMSVHNVKYHVAQLLVKLEAANRVHAVARARERGLLDDRPPALHPAPDHTR